MEDARDETANVGGNFSSSGPTAGKCGEDGRDLNIPKINFQGQ